MIGAIVLIAGVSGFGIVWSLIDLDYTAALACYSLGVTAIVLLYVIRSLRQRRPSDRP